MNGVGIIMSIILGGLAGWIAEKIMGANIGLLTNILLGIVGAVFLNFLLSLMGFYTADTYLVQLIVAIVGACLLIFLWRAIKGRA
ncbi:GlsB/YeaQ/YmgE family stress response membrane protein [Aureimonas fodinaquatilis]|uniref:GlsB/YeaQ/YmgE family stress response membrane protein n=1 Tax=Aureimonas fodinaquatilis TaxID=2565783 RepID=A0A5B0DVT8_9HYPH|nr:GlsB/YeaQ/YmgE family stress response membrane protein [Aureimonas fodinaquatilis]KAA0970468.1 GlsB/YeaQ/YmgE family stress response membrane protein [Aureimonas fodinaquatilis]